MSDLEKYVDKAMFPAAPMKSKVPEAHLLWATPDPLGAMAACVRMYMGKPTFSLSEITDDERKFAFDRTMETKLQTPFEAVQFHFFVEGVNRSQSHQAVRQRMATFAQESMRFAVKDGDLMEETSRPPSLDDPTLSQSQRNDRQDLWEEGIRSAERIYKALIADGMPAEDARDIMPHAVLTRYNYMVDLRNIMAEAGKRLCTQAQFHWRKEFLSIREQVKNYVPDFSWALNVEENYLLGDYEENFRWQWELIADSPIFSPVCYQIGECGFKAEGLDRGCTIRDRVEAFHKAGVLPEKWSEDRGLGYVIPIHPAEWLEDEKAGFIK